ncbi:MAG: energy transducer TonB [Betaproteobacteria bacterium]|nr:energy transducer TonB [Betaproteobacteria bacterium]
MPAVNDPCWRDASGVAALELPFRVTLPDGSTRTDPSQWSEDADVLAATGWARSTLTQADIDLLFPAPPAPPAPAAPPPSYPASIDSKTCSNSDEFYPRQSRQLNETGTVVLRFVVEANGSLSSVDVEKSSGYRRLDQAARKLLETCKFKPGMVSGKLEKSSATLEVVWKLD